MTPRIPQITRGLAIVLACSLGSPAWPQADAPPVDEQPAKAPGAVAGQRPLLKDLPRGQVVAMLGDADYATRQLAEDHLLADDTLGLEALEGLMKGAASDEQRFRLMRVAEHHVMRALRERAFVEADPPGGGREPRLVPQGASIGFSYAPARPGAADAADSLEGVTVIATMPGFPGHAHLRPGDTIVAIDGNPAANRPAHQEVTAWVSWRISTHRAGEAISFTLIRDGRARLVTMRCAQATALAAMYTTDGNKAASRSAHYEQLWAQARDRLIQALPEPRMLAPEP